MAPYPEIGPRQTVDRAKHPTLGEGRLVHRNGPAFFVADSGEWCALSNVDFGGSRTGPPRYSYKTAYQDGKRIELEDTERANGDVHDRIFSPMIGAAWLVQLGVHPERRWQSRIEPDGGKPFEIVYHQMWVGLAEHGADRMNKKLMTEQDFAAKAGWRTYRGDFGTFTWCYEVDAEKARRWLEHRNDPAHPKAKKNRPRKTSGPLPDFANMTRSQIEAWEKGA